MCHPTVTAIVILTLALCVALLPMLPLGAPYDGMTVAAISDGHLANLPDFPLRLPAGFASVEYTRVRDESTRLPGLETIFGAETFVTTPGVEGGLTLLDARGVLHLASGPTLAEAKVTSSERIGIVGRPLGYAYDAAGRLVICDCVGGLLRYDLKTKVMEVLSNSLADGTFLHYVNDLSISKVDGKIYFSSATSQPVNWHIDGYYDTMLGSKMNLIHGEPTGRLLVYDPETRTTSKPLLEGLFFANGVSLSAEEDFVLVCESFGARVLRYWLKGPKAGKHDVFVSRLPGFPDGVSLREGGGFWVALVNPPNALVFAARSQAFRAGVAHLLPYVEPLVKRWGAVANISASGEKVSLLLDLKGEKVTAVASVHQRGRWLCLGNLMGKGVSVLKLGEGE